MDSVDERLKDLITYVNRNSQFTIFAVQLEYYKHDEYEIVIPKLFGAEGTIVKPPTTWTEETMLQLARRKFSGEEYNQFETIYQFSKGAADHINFGTGSYASFSPIFRKLSRASLFTLGTDKRLSFNFAWVVQDNPQIEDSYRAAVEGCGFQLPPTIKGIRPRVFVDEWGPRTSAFIDAIKRLLQQSPN